jgi:hypothetical protein
MDLRLYTWNGIAINDGTVLRSSFAPGQKANLRANPITVNRAGEFPALSDVQLPAHVLVIDVDIAAGQNLNAKRELIKQYFNITDRQRHNLIARDAADSNREWYVTGFPIAIVPRDEPVVFSITFAIEYPYWKLVTAASSSWPITASAQTAAVTNIGNIPVPPVFEITPTSAKTGGLQYRRWVPIYNNLGITYTDALDVTDGGFDTASLTTAKMQADGDDFLLWLDGGPSDRWLDAMDSAATKCWTNISLAPRKEGTTITSIANTGAVASLSFDRTRANLAFLQGLKRAVNKVFLIDDEAFIYDAANVSTFEYKITSLTRAAKNTTADTHAQPKTVRHIEHDLWVLYGDSTLTAPDVDDDNKPIFDLDSTNASRAYTNFYQSAVARPGAWAGGVTSSRSDLSYLFTANENTFSDPSTELGMAMTGPAGTTLNETGVIQWAYGHPAGIESAAYNGKKYVSALGSWPGIVGLQYLQSDSIWVTQENEAEPTIASTWEVIGAHTETLPEAYTSIRFVMDGSLSAVPNARAMVQFDAVTINLSTASLPSISIGSEQAAYYFDFILENLTTGEALRCTVPCGLDETLTIDCENKQAYLSDGGRATVILSTERENWLNLAPGANVLRYTDTGTNAVTLITEHRDRTI